MDNENASKAMNKRDEHTMVTLQNQTQFITHCHYRAVKTVEFKMSGWLR